MPSNHKAIRAVLGEDGVTLREILVIGYAATECSHALLQQLLRPAQLLARGGSQQLIPALGIFLNQVYCIQGIAAGANRRQEQQLTAIAGKAELVGNATINCGIVILNGPAMRYTLFKVHLLQRIIEKANIVIYGTTKGGGALLSRANSCTHKQ